MNRAFCFLLVLATTGLAPSAADAARPSARPDDDRGVTADGRLLSARDPAPSWGAPADPGRARAWRRFRAAAGSAWASWDARTGVPRRILLAGVPAPGTSASAAAASRFATDLLADHIDLLAPGASPSDFVEVANVDAAGLRTVGFVQQHAGEPVLGGQISLRFSHDRLVAIGSEAWPDVVVPAPLSRRADADARRDVEGWLSRDLAGPVRAGTVGDAVILPVPSATGITYRRVIEVTAEGDGPPTRWSVWIDAHSGDPVARRQTLLHAGTLSYDVPVRGPLAARVDLPAPFTEVAVDGGPQVTTLAGAVDFAGASANVTTGLQGPFARIVHATGDLASAVITVPAGGVGVWSGADDELVDAQLTAWIHTHAVKEYVRAIDPGLAWLDSQIQVTVNRNDDDCNANSDGDSINFFLATGACENTGRLSDVVYHEFGHSVHTQSVIPGVGAFDVALSEGISDYLSATITGDSGLARGFFYDETPLRELDPEGFEHSWPADIGEVHYTGLIIGGALWDLRELMIAKYGEALGVQLTDRIWYESTRRAVDIPSMYAEALVVDDDDGDLSNGTPNACEINAAYGPHGLFSAPEGGEHLQVDPITGAVVLDVALPSFPACPVQASATLEVKQRGEPDAAAVVLPMPADGASFVATLPAGEPDTVQQYRVRLSYSNGAERSFPDNLADPWYERFVGEVVPIFCTSFADGTTDWELDGADSGFEVGPPPATSSVDPTVPAGPDAFVLGSELDGVGEYGPFSHAEARSPVISIPSGFASVRLQYQRWLTVEDGFFDQATIVADDAEVWSNFASDNDNEAVIHHRDREWRFHDVDVTDAAADGALEIGFTLDSDPGLQFGGWTIDEVCVVGVGSANPGCGDGILDPAEDCDDGNRNDGDGCSAACTFEGDEPGATGGGPTGAGDDDDGDDSGDDDRDDDDAGLDDDQGRLIDRGCVCNAGAPSGPPAWAWLGLWILVSRRRRRVTRAN